MNAIAKKLQSITEKGGLLLVDIANVLETRPETVSRWNQGRAFPRGETERLLLDLEWIVDQLSDFYDPKEARMWLFSRQKLFDGKSPADLISAGKIEDVLDAVRQLRDSIHA
jgi:uncharacterized protein (DUF2384 family)